MNSLILGFFKKHKLVIVPILVGISAVVIITLVIVPQILGYFDIKGQINQRQIRLAVLEAKANELTKLDSSETQKGLEVVAVVLPNEADIAGVVADLQSLARKSNLEVSHAGFINSQGPTEKKNNFQIEIKLIGPISNLRTFLLSLQNFPRIVLVENITVQSTTTSVESTLPLTIYYSADKTLPNSPVDQPVSALTPDQKKILTQLAVTVKSKSSVIDNTPILGPSATASAVPVPIGKFDPFN